jgi:membrane associated rhomboid family serine protease
MSIDSIFQLLFYLILIFQAIFVTIPLGTESANRKRFPMLSAMFIAINIYVFAMTFTLAEKQEYQYGKVTYQLLDLLEQNPAMLKLSSVQDSLRKTDLVLRDKATFQERISLINSDVVLPERDDRLALEELGSEAVPDLVAEFESLMAGYNRAVESNIYYRYGMAPNGRWTFGQLFTHMFLHADGMHLLGNMVFLFALGWGLEECWKPHVFIPFYLLAGMAACVPSMISPSPGPAVGASGAISGILGACLVSMRKTRVKVGWLSPPGAIFLLLVGKKPYGVLRVPSYVFLTFYFITDLTFWWVTKKSGTNSGVGHSAHVGGFFFGAFFAVLYEAYRSVKDPEAFATSISDADKRLAPLPIAEHPVRPEVAEAISLLQDGRTTEAETRLKVHLFTYPEDADAIKALIGIYRRSSNHEKAKELSARLIKNYLRAGDNPSAVLAYTNLTGMLEPDQVEPGIGANDLMVLCEQMRRQGMNREAIVECDRFAKAFSHDPLATRAYVIGGEAALSVSDKATALRFFEAALRMNPASDIEARARRGIEVSRCLIGDRLQVTGPRR